MSEPVTESYEVKTEDGELHVINICVEAVERHLTNQSEKTSEHYEEMLKASRIRVAEYLLARARAS